MEKAHQALNEKLETYGAAKKREIFDLTLGPAQRMELAGRYGDLGRLYLAHGLTHLAGICFSNASQLAPGDFGWQYLHGVALFDSGDFEAAQQCWKRALALKEDDPPVALRLGDVCLTLGHLDLSREYFEHALGLGSDKAVAYYGLARSAFLQQDYPTAIDYFQKALSLQPDSTAVHHQMGLIYRELGQVEKARTHFSQAGSRRPTFKDPLIEELGAFLEGARVHLVRGIEAQLRQQPKKAEEHFRKAVSLDPKNAHAQHNLGAVLGILGDHGKAIVHLKLAVKLEPKRKDAHFDLASAHSRTGSLQQADHHFSRVLLLDPGDRTAQRRRALVWAALGKKQDALGELEALAGDPADLESRYHFARTLFQDGGFQRAKLHFSAVAESFPNRIRAHMGVLFCAMALGQEKQALNYMEQLPPALQGSLPLKHLLARILATATQIELRDANKALVLARDVFRQQASLQHGETVAMAMAASGHYSQARQWVGSLWDQARKGGATEAVIGRLERQMTAYDTKTQAQVDWSEALP